MLSVRLFVLCVMDFVSFLFLLAPGIACDLRLWPSLDFSFYLSIMKICLFIYTETFSTKKNENLQIKNSYIFHISAQNIDCGYSLNRLGETVLTNTHNLCF